MERPLVHEWRSEKEKWAPWLRASLSYVLIVCIAACRGTPQSRLWERILQKVSKRLTGIERPKLLASRLRLQCAKFLCLCKPTISALAGVDEHESVLQYQVPHFYGH